MKSIEETNQALNFIRSVLDIDVEGADIDSIVGKAIKLTQLMGLSAEAIASSKKLLHIKELAVLYEMDKKLSPSIMSKMLTAECFNEVATCLYADKTGAYITHTCDMLRSVISLYKQELQSSLMQPKQN